MEKQTEDIARNLAAAYISLRDPLDAAIAEIKRLREDLAGAQETADAWRTVFKESEGELKEQRELVADLRAQYVNRLAQIDSLKAEVDRLSHSDEASKTVEIDGETFRVHPNCKRWVQMREDNKWGQPWRVSLSMDGLAMLDAFDGTWATVSIKAYGDVVEAFKELLGITIAPCGESPQPASASCPPPSVTIAGHRLTGF
jgi:hypothetical protein